MSGLRHVIGEPSIFSDYAAVFLHVDKLDGNNCDSWAYDIKLWLRGQDYEDHGTQKTDSIAEADRSWRRVFTHPQRLYGICQNLMSVVAPRQFDGTMVDYLGKVNGLLFDFNELLPSTSTPNKEHEQEQSFFMLLVLYGLLTEYSLVRDHILGFPNIPTYYSAWSTLLHVPDKPFVDVDVPPPHVDSSALLGHIIDICFSLHVQPPRTTHVAQAAAHASSFELTLAPTNLLTP
ncbi:hypothetical protein GLYMA_20G003800v4 [Glycine max]|uniref:Uncharacterized protein n=1 Tax=Glycine max TaxID=3847 RepID=K7N0K2_SOYBN|nr:hypothetical protein GYH30_054352 [Glycine max]KRG89140.1 hypothetical protein GLYMA_20G003800v4 [Glycine max]